MNGPFQRVWFFGASNLWLSRRTAIAASRRRIQGPLEIGLACGPGRSYGLVAGNLMARYPPLREVTFPQSDRVPTLAWIGDVGNDLVYGQSPATTLGWVAELADRLQASGAQVVLTGLPEQSLQELPRWLFWLACRLYYSGREIAYETMLGRVEELETGLRRLATERGLPFFATEPWWYGWDRFHLKSSGHQPCWETWWDHLSPAIAPFRLPAWHRVLGFPLGWAGSAPRRLTRSPQPWRLDPLTLLWIR